MYNNIKLGFRWVIVIVTLLSALQWSQPVQADGFASPVHDPANTWYVSTTGSDANDCATPSTPCQTISKVMESVTDGNIVKIEQGDYSQGNLNINVGISLLGGWDSAFTAQTGSTTLSGMAVEVTGSNVVVDRINITESIGLSNYGLLTISNCEVHGNSTNNLANGGGILNYGTLTIDNCKVYENINTLKGGGGIYNSGVLTINTSEIHDNIASGDGGGILNKGSLTITDSQIYKNSAGNMGSGGGIYSDNNSSLTSITRTKVYQNHSEWSGGGIAGPYSDIKNSAIYENVADQSGGGISGGGLIQNTTIAKNFAKNRGGGVSGVITLNNVTITENQASTGGAIFGNLTFYNTLVSGNTALSGSTCAVGTTIAAKEKNIIHPADYCVYSTPIGVYPDYVDVDPKLIAFIPALGYAPINEDSPAINAGSSTSCYSTTDQRGVARVGTCDIGAYEYSVSGAPIWAYPVSGYAQRVPPNSVFKRPFVVIAVDANGTPSGPGYGITFSTPSTGPSGFFASNNRNSETVVTTAGGVATSSLLIANGSVGDYSVAASATGTSNFIEMQVGNGYWTVSTEGDDANSCLYNLAPCHTIEAVLQKKNFYSGDQIRVQTGRYYQGTQIWIEKDVTITGGWNSDFSVRSGTSRIHQTINVTETGSAVIKGINVEGIPYTGYVGGVVNKGVLTFEDGSVQNGHGFTNNGILTIRKATISGNSSPTYGGGLINSGLGAKAVIINSTISSNTADQAGAIFNDSNYSPTIEIYNSTISNNVATGWGSGGIEGFAGVTIGNSIIVGNISPPQSSTAYGPDCRGTFTSLGYNIVGNVGNMNAGRYPCSTKFDKTDRWGNDTKPIPTGNVLLPLVDVGKGIWMHPLFPTSLAVDTGNPLSPGTPSVYACPITDQRGLMRPQGLRCDIGAYEYGPDPGIFFDVPQNHWAWKQIESIYNAGITDGCSANPLMYCPSTTVTRAQMAVFLGRGIHGSSFIPPNPTGTAFLDIPSNHWAAAWIEQFSSDGITGGCANGNFCPDYPVTRDQMAVFLLRAEHGKDYIPPTATGTMFGDVPDTFWAAAWIEQLAAEGITGGCGGGNYCPGTPVTRDQMAVFLQRTFKFLLP